MKNSILLLILAVLYAFNTTYAQFVGTASQTGIITVVVVKKKAFSLSRNDRIIKVKGFIVEQFGEDYFWFEDKTGKIKVEIEPKHLPAIPFTRDTEVEISGEVCYPLIGRIYIGAKKVEITGKLRNEN